MKKYDKDKRKLLGVFLFIGLIIAAVMFKNAYASSGFARAVGEHNVSRSVMINLNGGTTSGAGWMATIDRTGNGYTAGNGWWYVPASGSISPVDKTGNINRSAGNKGQNDGYGNRSVIHLNQWNSQYMDCVGITPYIWVSTPSRFGYTLTGWSTSGTTKSVQTLWGNYALNVGAYSGSGTPHQTNISMTANWRANTYYVYYNANGGWSAPGTQSFTFNSGARISSSVPVRTGYTFAGWDYAGNHFNPGQSIPSGWGSFTLTAKWNINSYYLDVNGMLDGVSNGGLAHYGTFDVYINGGLVANDVSDYYTAHPYGTSYSITDIRAKPGYQYNGVYSGSVSGTIGGNTATVLNMSTSNYQMDYNPDNNNYGVNAASGARVTSLNITRNGGLVANGVSDYNDYSSKLNDSYIIHNVKYKAGYRYAGVSLKDSNGTTYPVSVTDNNTRFTFKHNATRAMSISINTIPSTPPVITIPVISNPDNNEIKPFINEGKLIIQKGDIFTPLKYATANDKEDGNITPKVIVSQNNVPLQNGRAMTSGTFNVTYKVTDSDGAYTTNTLTVIVNEPAVITAQNRAFFINQYQVGSAELLKKAIAQDKEDGNITSKLKVISAEYLSTGHMDTNFQYLDTSKLDIVKITYEVTDKYKKTVRSVVEVKVVENPSIEINKTSGSIRFISDEYIFSLNNTSIWKTNQSLNNQLKSSIESSQPKNVYKYDKNEIKEIRGYLNKSEYRKGESTNQYFKDIFMK